MLATALHKTPREIGEMELQEIDCLMDSWADYPPVHVAVALYLGMGEKKYMTAEEFANAVGAKRKGPKSG